MVAIESFQAGPTQRVSHQWVACLCLANLGLFTGYFGPLAVLLPDQVQADAGPAHKVVAFGLVSGLGAAVAMLANPLAGALSDRTAGRFGRRRPWILGGAVASAAALVLLAGQHSVVGIAVGWCLAQAALNTMQAGITACIPDRVPVEQRGLVSGWFGVPQTVGAIVAAALVSKIVTGTGGYLALAALTVLLALPFALGTRDGPSAPARRAPFRWRGFLYALCTGPVRSPDFGWAWLTRFLMVLGNSVAVLYLLYFLRDRVHYSALFPGQPAENGLVILLLVYTVVVVASTLIGGALSDRSGRRRRPVALSGVLMAVPAVLLALWPTWPMSVTAAAVLGVGFGVYLSVDQALITQVLPSADGRARDLGVISVASSAGQALAPAIAAPLVTHWGGYSTLYFCVAGIVLLGSLTVLKIRSVR